MNVEINFTCLNMELSLCLVCNLGAYSGGHISQLDRILIFELGPPVFF